MLPRRYEPTIRYNLVEKRSASVACQLAGNTATLVYNQFLAKRPNKLGVVFT